MKILRNVKSMSSVKCIKVEELTDFVMLHKQENWQGTGKHEGEGKEYDTDYTIKLLSNDQSFGTVVSPVEMNFYSMHWSYINVNDNYMAYPCIIKIDGVEQTNPNLELAAFINNELRGVARPKLEEAVNIYIANLKIDGNNGQTISFKLYVPEVGELETDYTAIYDIDYGNGLVTQPSLNLTIQNGL